MPGPKRSGSYICGQKASPLQTHSVSSLAFHLDISKKHMYYWGASDRKYHQSTFLLFVSLPWSPIWPSTCAQWLYIIELWKIHGSLMQLNCIVSVHFCCIQSLPMGMFGVLLPQHSLKKVFFKIVLQLAGIVVTVTKACKYDFLLTLRAEEEHNRVLSHLQLVIIALLRCCSS